MRCFYHDDEIVAANTGQRRQQPYEQPATDMPITYLLYRCRICARVVARTIDGHWTLEQIRGEPDAASSARSD